jgi:hypothetical protein
MSESRRISEDFDPVEADAAFGLVFTRADTGSLLDC